MGCKNVLRASWILSSLGGQRPKRHGGSNLPLWIDLNRRDLYFAPLTLFCALRESWRVLDLDGGWQILWEMSTLSTRVREPRNGGDYPGYVFLDGRRGGRFVRDRRLFEGEEDCARLDVDDESGEITGDNPVLESKPDGLQEEWQATHRMKAALEPQGLVASGRSANYQGPVAGPGSLASSNLAKCIDADPDYSA